MVAPQDRMGFMMNLLKRFFDNYNRLSRCAKAYRLVTSFHIYENTFILYYNFAIYSIC